MEEGSFAMLHDGALVTVEHVEKDAGVACVRHCGGDGAEDDDEFVEIESLWPTVPSACAAGGHGTATAAAAAPEGWDLDLDSGAVAAAAECAAGGQEPLVCCALSPVAAGVDGTTQISGHGKHSRGRQIADAPERGVFARFDIGPGVTVLKAEAYVVIMRGARDNAGVATGEDASERVQLHPAVDVRCCDTSGDSGAQAGGCIASSSSSSSGREREGADELFGRAVAGLREPALAAHASHLGVSCGVDEDSMRLVLATMAQQQRRNPHDRRCTWQHVARLQAPASPRREALGQLAALLHAMMWGRASPTHAPDVAGVCRLLMAVRCNAHPLSLDSCGGSGRARAVGLFPAAAMINHTCHGAACGAPVPATCNVACHPSADGRWLFVRTVRGVRAGEELRCSYLQNMYQPRADRERALLQGWGIRLASPAGTARATSTGTGVRPVPDDLFGAFQVGRHAVLRQHATPDMLRLVRAVEERITSGQQALAANDLPGAARHFAAAAALADSTVVAGGVGDASVCGSGARLHSAHTARFEAALGLVAASQRLGDFEATARAAWAALRSWGASGLPHAHPQVASMHWAHCRAATRCDWAHLRGTSSARGGSGVGHACARDIAREHLRRCAEVHRICFGEGHALVQACKRLLHGYEH